MSEFQFGDVVYVRDYEDHEWRKARYICTIGGGVSYPFHALVDGRETADVFKFCERQIPLEAGDKCWFREMTNGPLEQGIFLRTIGSSYGYPHLVFPLERDDPYNITASYVTAY